MKSEGPVLEVLLRRLAETPRDFLDPPRVGDAGLVHVDALIFDLSHQMGQACTRDDLLPFRSVPSGNANWLTLCAVGCWLLGEDSLRPRLKKAAVLHFLGSTLQLMAKEYAAGKYVLDPERREELARIALADLGVLPAGETKEQAQDRLQALSSTERRRVIAAARETEKRAREIREALIKKAAAEAADKYTRE
jgi:hypothetical protein